MQDSDKCCGCTFPLASLDIPLNGLTVTYVGPLRWLLLFCLVVVAMCVLKLSIYLTIYQAEGVPL